MDTPTQLVEDINEVIEEETGIAPFSSYKGVKIEDCKAEDSGYGSFKRKRSGKEVGRYRTFPVNSILDGQT